MHTAHVINQAYASYGTALRLQIITGRGKFGTSGVGGKSPCSQGSPPPLCTPAPTPLELSTKTAGWRCLADPLASPPPRPAQAPAARATDGLAGNCRFVVVHIQGFDVLIDTFNPRAHHAKRTHLPSYFRNIIEIFRSRHNYFNYFSLVFETHTQESQIRK